MNNKIKPMRGSVNRYCFEDLQYEPTNKEFKWQGLIFQLDLISDRTIYYNENPYIHIFISKPVYDKHHTSNIRYQFLIKKTKLESKNDNPIDPFCDIAAKEIEVHQSLVNTPDKTPFISSHTIDNFRRIIFEPQAYNLRDIILMLKEAEIVMAHKQFMEIFNSRKKSYLAIIILKSFLDLIFRNGNSQNQLHLIYGNINCSNILFSFDPDDNNTKYDKLHCYLVDINRQGKYDPGKEHFAQTLASDLKNLAISIIQFLNNFDQMTEQSSIPVINSSLINLKETQFLKKLPVIDETNSFSTLHRIFQDCLEDKKWIDLESLRPVYDILCEPEYSKKCQKKANNFINRLYKTTKIEPYSRFLK